MAAPAVMVTIAVTVVSFTTWMPLALTPPPEKFTAVAPDRSVPVRVTATDVPWVPAFGLIAVRVGPVTVNVTALLGAIAAVVTVTLRTVRAALLAMENVAVT